MGFLRLKKRRSFLAAAKSGQRFSCGAFLLQSKENPGETGPFFGFTATRRLGKAVQRNRAKRRLKAAVEATLQEPFSLKNRDYVLVARPEIFDLPFDKLVHSLKKGILFLSREKSA